MQAQDYTGALWAIGLRLPGATETTVEQAVTSREIVRTWPMRGTLHFVAAADARWMLELLAPRNIASSTRRCRELGLDDAFFARCRKLVERALARSKPLKRESILQLLTRAGMKLGTQMGYHILWRLAQERVICFAAREGKQHTFALFDKWVTKSTKLNHEEALAELARRYFTSHGPATLQDYVWWSGLKVAEAKAGLDSVRTDMEELRMDGDSFWISREIPKSKAGGVCLLPGFDQFLLGYTHRGAVLDEKHADKIVPGGNGMFLPTIVREGRVTGTWKRVPEKKKVVLTVKYFEKLKRADDALLIASDRYGRFLGLPAELKFAK